MRMRPARSRPGRSFAQPAGWSRSFGLWGGQADVEKRDEEGDEYARDPAEDRSNEDTEQAVGERDEDIGCGVVAPLVGPEDGGV